MMKAVLVVLLALATALASPGLAEDTPAGTAWRGGAACIAPFQGVDRPVEQMLMEFGPPSPEAEYSFRFDRKKDLLVTVKAGEMGRISGLPLDRKVLVEVRADGRPMESFWIDFREWNEKRLCFWLYRGYWHWLVMPWDPKLGCRCDFAAKSP